MHDVWFVPACVQFALVAALRATRWLRAASWQVGLQLDGGREDSQLSGLARGPSIPARCVRCTGWAAKVMHLYIFNQSIFYLYLYN